MSGINGIPSSRYRSTSHILSDSRARAEANCMDEELAKSDESSSRTQPFPEPWSEASDRERSASQRGDAACDDPTPTTSADGRSQVGER